jgi:hypothetical protein
VGGLDNTGRARVEEGEGLEAYGRGAAPAQITGNSIVKLPSTWPGSATWGSVPLPRPEGGGLPAF